MYYLLQFQPRGKGDGWKVFRVNSRIQVYKSEKRAVEDAKKNTSEFDTNFRVKTIHVHPGIEHPKCMWQDVG